MKKLLALGGKLHFVTLLFNRREEVNIYGGQVCCLNMTIFWIETCRAVKEI